jgi:hypothetical protein
MQTNNKHLVLRKLVEADLHQFRQHILEFIRVTSGPEAVVGDLDVGAKVLGMDVQQRGSLCREKW